MTPKPCTGRTNPTTAGRNTTPGHGGSWPPSCSLRWQRRHFGSVFSRSSAAVGRVFLVVDLAPAGRTITTRSGAAAITHDERPPQRGGRSSSRPTSMTSERPLVITRAMRGSHVRRRNVSLASGLRGNRTSAAGFSPPGLHVRQIDHGSDIGVRAFRPGPGRMRGTDPNQIEQRVGAPLGRLAGIAGPIGALAGLEGTQERFAIIARKEEPPRHPTQGA